MAIEFNTLSSKYQNAYRNGIGFDLNSTEFASRLVGNIGDTFKLTQQVQFGIIYNSLQSITTNIVDIDGTGGTGFFAQGINFYNEGFFVGATIIIEWENTSSGLTSSYTLTDGVQSITSKNNSTIYISNTDFGGIQSIDPALGVTEFSLTSFVFKQTSKPSTLRYKYDLRPQTEGNASADLFKSPFDNNQQCYLINSINNIGTNELPFAGNEIGSSLGSVELTFNSTSDDYKHTYTLEHVFKPPYYIDSELNNIENGLNPPRFAGGNTYAYSNQYSFGNGGGNNAVVTQLSNNGNVGYTEENFNGFGNNYTVSDVEISNDSNTGTLEATETNTVTFKLKNLVGNWNESEKIELIHSKLLTANLYANEIIAFDDLWLYETLSNTTGSTAVNGVIISDFTADVDGTDLDIVNVSFDINYSTLQQENITTQNYFWLALNVGTQNDSSPELFDRITKTISVDNYSRNYDVDLINTENYSLSFYPEFDATNQTLRRDDITGGDGDLWLTKLNFQMINSFEPKIQDIFFKVMSIDADGNEFIVWERSFRFLDLALENSTTQFIQEDYSSGLNVPTTQDINKVKIETQYTSGLFQDVLLSFGFQTTWQDWIENLNVPISFYDNTKPQNNRNIKTSNYGNVLGFTNNIFPCIEINFRHNVNPFPTKYRWKGLSSTVIGFDDYDEWEGDSATTRIYDSNDNQITAIRTDENCRIEINFEHSEGTINVSNIAGVVFMMRTDSFEQPSYIGTDYNYLMPNGKLIATDTLSTGNTENIEIVSTNNLVKFICQTDHNKIIENANFSIYSRIRLKQV